MKYAISSGHVEIVDLFLRNKNVALDIGCLHDAIRLSDVEMVQVLAPYFPINDQDNVTGHTVLHTAVASGNTEIVSYLLDQGADMEIVNLVGLSPFLCSIFCKSTDVVQLFIGRNPFIVNIEVNNALPLHHAIMHGLINMVKVLVPFVQNHWAQNGISSLYLAVNFGNPLIVKAILPSIKDFSTTYDGLNIFQVALIQKRPQIVKLLLPHLDPTSPFPKLKFILDTKVNLTEEDYTVDFCEGNLNSLIVAVGNQDFESVVTLLPHFKNPNDPLPNGLTPIDLARKLNRLDIVHLIQKQIGDDPPEFKKRRI